MYSWSPLVVSVLEMAGAFALLAVFYAVFITFCDWRSRRGGGR